MRITKENWKKWNDDFLLGKLSPEMEEQYFCFLENHPDLIAIDEELEQYSLIQLSKNCPFKEELKKPEQDCFELPLLDYLAVKQNEEGLDRKESQTLNALLKDNPERKNEVHQYELVYLKANDSICFSHKSSLKRHSIQGWIVKSIIGSASAAAILFMLFRISPPEKTAGLEMAKVQTVLVSAKDSVKKIDLENKNAPMDSVRSVKNEPEKTHTGPKMVEPLLELKEPMIAINSSFKNDNIFEVETINGYENGLNVMMPLYLSIQMELQNRETEYAINEIKTATEKKQMGLKLVENGVRLANLFKQKKMTIDKYYDNEGNLIAYKLKGEGLEWTNKINK